MARNFSEAFSKILGTIICSLLLIYVSPLLTFGQDDPCKCDEKPKAYIFKGDITISQDGELSVAFTNAAITAAIDDFSDAGYKLEVKTDGATAEDVKNALKDPCIRALWIIGHGKYDEGTGLLGIKKLNKPAEMINMQKDTFIEGKRMEVNTCVKSVTFHSCGQDLPSWRALFPNAEFYSWSSQTRAIWMAFWQIFHDEPNIDEIAAAPRLPPPVIHPSLEQEGQSKYDEVTGKYFAETGPVANAFSMPDEQAELLGTQVFNFYVTADDKQESFFLFGAKIEIGQITDQYSEPSESSFDVYVTNSALYSILEEPSHVDTAYLSEDLKIQPIAPTENPEILYRGIAALLFGVTYEDGITAVSLEGKLAATWGAIKKQCSVPAQVYH